MSDEYESEITASRDDVAAVLGGVVDGIAAGSVRLGDGAEDLRIDVPDEVTLEIEFEADDDGLSLELELEWPDPAVAVEDAADAHGADGHEGDDGPPVPVGAATGAATVARFEVFRDRRDEWRWRLRHRNGNVIATSGEGYTRKHNARKGLRSVVRNAPDAEVTEETT